MTGSGDAPSPQRKLVLCVVDSLRTDMLERAVESGDAPIFAALLDRGELIGDCVAPFPSVTPVCNSAIATGVDADRHWISGSNWFHRAERRYVEYGSSFEATRVFGVFRTLYDIVYNMNMSHLSHEVETIFERLADRGLRSACTPFLIYRGRRRHEVGLEGVLRRLAEAASFRHATWGPDELFYGELYSSRAVGCRPTLARPGTRDEYSACAGRELVERDLYDFMLFSLPDNDHHSHKFGPEAQPESIARADAALAELVDAAGGLEAFLERNAVILMADHAQSEVDRPLPLAAELGRGYRVLGPNDDVEHAQLAVSPIARAAGVYVLSHGRAAVRLHEGVRNRLEALEGVELFAWLEDAEGRPAVAGVPGAEPPPGATAAVQRGGSVLRFRPGGDVRDRRGRAWSLEGDRAVLAATDGPKFDSPAYPDALHRVWSALRAPHAADLLVSAAPGYELVDWGGMTHCPGGSHGSLRAEDSTGPLLFCGFGEGISARHEQWLLTDVAEIVLEHFGVASARPSLAAAGGAG